MDKGRFCVLLIAFFLTGLGTVSAQDPSLYPDSSATTLPIALISEEAPLFLLPEKKTLGQKYAQKKILRDSLRARRKVWCTVLGGPSYSPESSVGIGAAMLISFRMNRRDTISARSFIPMGLTASLNGTFIAQGTAALFMNQNKIRFTLNYGFRYEPANYFGKGFERAENTPKGKETSRYQRYNIIVYPKILFQVAPAFYIGAVSDFSYISTWKLSKGVQGDDYFNRFNREFRVIGHGGTCLYDTRDDIATPYKGVMLQGIARCYGKYTGSQYNFDLFSLEYRQYKGLFAPYSRHIFAWTFKTEMSVGNTPYSELPTFGSVTDLRGFYAEKYRDFSMAYGMLEYRFMLGTLETAADGDLLSKIGFVAWTGLGTLGKDPSTWTKWKWCYGIGLRFEVQPRKNLRFDLGKGHDERGILFYMSLTEAF